MPIVNVDALNRASEKYNPVLQVLPFLRLEETLSNLQINLLEVVGRDKFVTFERMGGTSRPYAAGITPAYTNLGKVIERTLEVVTAYNALKDHTMNLRAKLVATNDPAKEKIDNQQKKHPLELLILEEKVKTIAEDIIDALWFAERDMNDLSPLGMFNGFAKQIADEIAAGTVSVAKGNMYNTGAIVAPVNATDTTAFDQLVAFIRSAHPMLRKYGVLYISNTTLFHAQDALANKITSKDSFAFNVFLEHLKGSTQTPNLKIITDYSLGTGDQLTFTAPRNLDLGVNTKGDHKFIEIRRPWEDPNLVQFWSQWDAGTRIRHIHPKMFLVNNGVPVSNELSGDYTS